MCVRVCVCVCACVESLSALDVLRQFMCVYAVSLSGCTFHQYTYVRVCVCAVSLSALDGIVSTCVCAVSLSAVDGFCQYTCVSTHTCTDEAYLQQTD